MLIKFLLEGSSSTLKCLSKLPVITHLLQAVFFIFFASHPLKFLCQNYYSQCDSMDDGPIGRTLLSGIRTPLIVSYPIKKNPKYWHPNLRIQ